MAIIFQAVNEAFADKLSVLKFIIYGTPVYFSAQFFKNGQMNEFYMLGGATAILLLTLMVCAISNIRNNNKEIITLNPLKLVWVLAKLSVAICPIVLVLIPLGNFIVSVIPDIAGIDNFKTIATVVVWVLIGSILLTSYLAFAKFLEIKQAYNIFVISNSCIDVVINLLFFIPQLVFVDVLLFIPIWYVFYFFKISFEHWSFLAYASYMFIANISIVANYFANVSYELIKGKNDEYDDKHTMTYLNIDDNERVN